MQQESSPEQRCMVMLQLGATCLSPSTYSDLCSLSFPLPNKRNKKTRAGLTELWHDWGQHRALS